MAGCVDPIEAMQFALEKGSDNPATVFVAIGRTVVLRAEIVVFTPGWDAKGNHAWFLYTKTHKIQIDEEQYDQLVDYFDSNTTDLE